MKQWNDFREGKKTSRVRGVRDSYKPFAQNDSSGTLALTDVEETPKLLVPVHTCTITYIISYTHNSVNVQMTSYYIENRFISLFSQFLSLYHTEVTPEQ